MLEFNDYRDMYYVNHSRVTPDNKPVCRSCNRVAHTLYRCEGGMRRLCNECLSQYRKIQGIYYHMNDLDN